MSEYLLEYSVALLHNLCLRSAGRWSLAGDAENVLRVLSDLLSHDNESLKSYLNGTLFSVLFIQSFKEKANQIGLKQIIDSFMRGDHAHKTVSLDCWHHKDAFYRILKTQLLLVALLKI